MYLAYLALLHCIFWLLTLVLSFLEPKMDHSTTAVVVLSSFVCIWRLRWDYMLSPAHVLLSVSCPSPLQSLWCERKSNASFTWEVISLAQGWSIVQILFLEVLPGIQLHLGKHGHRFPSAPLLLLHYSVARLSLPKPKVLRPGGGSANPQCKLAGGESKTELTSCVCQLVRSQQTCAVPHMVHRLLGSGDSKVRIYRSVPPAAQLHVASQSGLWVKSSPSIK